MRHSSRLQASKPSPSSSSKRSPNLHLPGLPRFHPANFPAGASVLSTASSTSTSQTSSTATSPPSGANSPQASSPIRPQYHVRQYSDAQRQLYAYQRELMHLNQYAGMTGRSPYAGTPSNNGHVRSPRSPRSPRLHPLGSPGPVTPLELDVNQSPQQRDGYMFAGAGINSEQLSEDAKDQILETFIQKEAAEAARGGLSPPPSQQSRASPLGGSPTVRRGDHTNHRSVLSR